MKAMQMNIKPLVIALFAAGILSACGGGGGGDDPPVGSGGGGTGTGTGDGTGGGGTGGGGTGGGGTDGGGTGGGGTQAPTLTMSCPDGAAPEHQCSGDAVLATDNGVMLTRSGVQVFGISASDIPLDTMLQPVPAGTNTGNPRGFALPSAAATPVTGVAEVRLLKNATTNDVTRVGLLLNGFGLSWDGTNPRPPIVETFSTTRERVELNAARALTFVTLPLGTDTAFFNRTAQANYANNTYFPITATPAIANNLLGAGVGGWRTANGTRGDTAETGREHQDGDVDAPSATVATGTKGFRGFTNIAYEFTNIAAWNSQDTVNIADWLTVPKIEHNKERRGIVAFGNVTSPDAVPTTGTATYTGTVFGLLGLPETVQDDPEPFVGTATVTVDYATGAATIAISGTETNTEPAVSVPAAFTTTAARGTVSGTSAPNYFSGAVSATGLTGGVSGRYFGPAAKEVGGSFQLAGPGNSVIIGGFVARKP